LSRQGSAREALLNQATTESRATPAAGVATGLATGTAGISDIVARPEVEHLVGGVH
jgi:hypothetical protein